jgi:hypothetical protein
MTVDIRGDLKMEEIVLYIIFRILDRKQEDKIF